MDASTKDPTRAGGWEGFRKWRGLVVDCLAFAGIVAGGACLGYLVANGQLSDRMKEREKAHAEEVQRLTQAQRDALLAITGNLKQTAEKVDETAERVSDAANATAVAADQAGVAVGQAKTAVVKANQAVAAAKAKPSPPSPPAAVQPDVVNSEIRRVNKQLEKPK